MTYETTIIIWSDIGNTPITGRAGPYCDELVRTRVQCESPEKARALTREIMQKTQYAYMGHFNMPEHPNQNTRNSFVMI
jgi:hypothetical protein